MWALRATVVATILMASAGCFGQRPPAGVPEGATRVSFSKSGGWAYCWLDPATQVNRCRTYNANGERLYRIGKKDDDDDVFLKYRGSGPVPQDQLKIDVVHSSRDFIWLQNDVVLLPRNDFEHQKEFVGELMRAGAKGAP